MTNIQKEAKEAARNVEDNCKHDRYCPPCAICVASALLTFSLKQMEMMVEALNTIKKEWSGVFADNSHDDEKFSKSIADSHKKLRAVVGEALAHYEQMKESCAS